jgi:hypothetical protein
MESINVKVHQPWFARGTPITNPRDGPAMALSDILLFAIRERPLARSKSLGLTRLRLIFKTVSFNTQKQFYSWRYDKIRPLLDDMIDYFTSNNYK